MWATSRSIARMRALRRHRVADGDRATVIACADAIQLFEASVRSDNINRIPRQNCLQLRGASHVRFRRGFPAADARRDHGVTISVTSWSLSRARRHRRRPPHRAMRRCHPRSPAAPGAPSDSTTLPSSRSRLNGAGATLGRGHRLTPLPRSARAASGRCRLSRHRLAASRASHAAEPPVPGIRDL